MAKLVWDRVGERLGEVGVENGVIYIYDESRPNKWGPGVPWNGLISVSESPEGAEPNDFYADNRKYISILSEEEYSGSVSCYMYPEEFKACTGEMALVPGVYISQQAHKKFCLVFKTKVANDTDGVDYGYKVHIVYNASVGVSDREHATISDSPSIEELSFDFTTTKIDVTGGKPTSHLVFESKDITPVNEAKFNEVFDTLFGSDGVGDTTITTAISDTDTSLVVASVTGLTGATPFDLTIGYDGANPEIVEVTAVNVGTKTLTITRKGVNDQSWPAGAKVAISAPKDSTLLLPDEVVALLA